MHCLFVFLSIGVTCGIIVHENVIFRKTNEVSITSARWLITFVHDLKPFESFLNKISGDMDEIEQLANSKLQYYDQSVDLHYKQTLELLKNEVTDINKTRQSILNNFAEYKFLQVRSKRSFFSFLV